VNAGFCVDQLYVYSKPVAAALHGAFKRVTNVQLAADLFEINSLALMSESGVSADDERPPDTRQVRGQARRRGPLVDGPHGAISAGCFNASGQQSDVACCRLALQVLLGSPGRAGNLAICS
jgi:hypothetical protein